jgi:tetratricopeptide (TPR) repeat protein
MIGQLGQAAHNFMSEESVEAERLFDEADQAWAGDRPQEAIDLINSSLALHPKSHRSLALRGRLNVVLANFEEAREDFLRSLDEMEAQIKANHIEANPEICAYIYVGLGQTYWKLGERDKSRENFDKSGRFFRLATQYDQDSAYAWFGVGISEAKLGRKSSARQAFEKAIELDETDIDPYVELVWLDLWSLRFRSAWRWFNIGKNLYFSNPKKIQ